MSDQVRGFYDDQADDYHLLFADWSVSIASQAKVLDRLIAAELGVGVRTILDCACGIGTQSIGLASRGHSLTASDISARAVRRLQTEAELRGLKIETGVADLRTLATDIPGRFEVVLACDNALPHLLSSDDLRRAIENMAAKLLPGGLLIASIRDYDTLKQERPPAQPPRVFDDPGGRRIAFQVWDWGEDGSRYDLQQFIVWQTGGTWTTRHFSTPYRALERAELESTVREAGLISVQWHEPAESGYYQPIITGRAAG